MSLKRPHKGQSFCLGVAAESRGCGESLSRIGRQAPFGAAFWVAVGGEHSKVA
jgi:hypothetical protein